MEASAMVKAAAAKAVTEIAAGKPIALNGPNTTSRRRSREATAESSSANTSRAEAATEASPAETATTEAASMSTETTAAEAAVSAAAEAATAAAVPSTTTATATAVASTTPTAARQRHVRRKHSDRCYRAQRDHGFTQHLYVLLCNLPASDYALTGW
jgi:hypothetical protein